MGLFPSYLHTSRSREGEADTVYYSISQYTSHGSITLKEISRFSAPHISICVSKVPILKKNSRSNANMQPSIMGVYISLHMIVNRCTVNSKHRTQKRMKPSKHLLYKGGMLSHLVSSYALLFCSYAGILIHLNWNAQVNPPLSIGLPRKLVYTKV